MKCEACGDEAKYTIELAKSSEWDEDMSAEAIRWYIPNQHVREAERETQGHFIEVVGFCHTCMRTVEDNLRATIAALQARAGGARI
jgi:hypothetical protein